MWKAIPAFPDYEINEVGDVRRIKTGRIVRPTVNQQGNAMIGLSRDGEQYKRSLALLVALAFLGEPVNYRFDTPIHVDGNKLNCRADNLMWRPRHFAVRYHRQFHNDERGFKVPIIEVNTREEFPTSWDAAVKYGLIDKEILISVINRTVVFPTGQCFRPIDDFEE